MGFAIGSMFSGMMSSTSRPRRGTVLVLVGDAAIAISFVLGAAIGVVDFDLAICTGCALSAGGGVVAFLNGW